jgi:F-type H+-transporting ATPase subunit a
MKELAQITTYTFKLPLVGWLVTINPGTLIVSWIVILLMLILIIGFTHSLQKVPTRKQLVMELTVGWFDNVLKESMGEEGRKFLPFIVSLFLFVLFCNWVTIIPRVPSPTKDLNTCLGLGLLVFFVAHLSAIRKKGFLKYLKGYFEPVWFLLPSNVFSEISKVLSHSFRLFGNIFAGGVVVSMVPLILWRIFKWWGLPINILSMPILNAFFGLFIGSIQAFVFAILAVAYISVLRE